MFSFIESREDKEACQWIQIYHGIRSGVVMDVYSIKMNFWMIMVVTIPEIVIKFLWSSTIFIWFVPHIMFISWPLIFWPCITRRCRKTKEQNHHTKSNGDWWQRSHCRNDSSSSRSSVHVAPLYLTFNVHFFSHLTGQTESVIWNVV